ncbi:MAG: hypothetical protein ACOCZ8_02685, partial [Bacteroidota bacterium]
MKKLLYLIGLLMLCAPSLSSAQTTFYGDVTDSLGLPFSDFIVHAEIEAMAGIIHFDAIDTADQSGFYQVVISANGDSINGYSISVPPLTITIDKIRLAFIDTCANDTTFTAWDTIVPGAPPSNINYDYTNNCSSNNLSACDPTFAVNVSGMSLPGLSGCEGVFFSNLTNYDPNTTYHWFLDGQPISIDTSHECVNTLGMLVLGDGDVADSLAPGTYQLCVEASSNQCTDSACQTFTIQNGQAPPAGC